jgi:hypothetical protein
MAISDALVAVMETKYHYALWRPETAIHEAESDGNPRTTPDATFAPYVATPCFPSYGSAHAAASHAARRITEAFFGSDCVSVTLESPACQPLVAVVGLHVLGLGHEAVVVAVHRPEVAGVARELVAGELPVTRSASRSRSFSCLWLCAESGAAAASRARGRPGGLRS